MNVPSVSKQPFYR